MNFEKILIAVDDSVYAMKAAEQGFALARALKAEVALVHVIDRGEVTESIDTGLRATEMLTSMRKEGNDLITQIVGMHGKNARVLHFLPEGNPTEQIVLMARTWGANLVVIGTHGRTGLKKLMMGSVAEVVVRKAPCPVMVVHETEND